MASVTILFFFLALEQVVSTVALTSERRSANGRPLLLLLRRGVKERPTPSQKGLAKEKATMTLELEAAEIPPLPLPQIMLPRNVTDGALKPPLRAAQVVPAPRRLVDVDVCRGYYDVMGQFDNTFNCTKDTYIYCCGTCHYRFCCEHQRNRLDQDSCTNYNSPIWANTQVPATKPPSRSDPDFDPLQQQSNNTAYVIGGVISFTLVVAIGVKVAFRKVSRRPRNRDINMPRALVDILRHQSSPVQRGERNNSTILTTATTSKGTPGWQSKKQYIPIIQSKDNRIGKHNLIQSGSSPKHTATIERVPRMNNAQLSTGPLLSSKTNNMGPHPTLSHSFHNLAQLPPAYEAIMKPEINRYSSLKRLEKDLDDYTGYTSTRRAINAPPSFHSSQHHLHWGGDYTLGARGTLPLHSSRPRLHVSTATSTPNPYPLPQKPYSSTFETASQPPRRVMSQDQLLSLGEGNTLSYLSKNQQHQYYKAMTTSKSSNSHIRKSNERLLVSPDYLEERMMGGGMGDYGGMMSPMSHLSHHKKAQSQQNVCVTPSLDRHHMIKMNSHPTSGCEQDRNVPVMSAGHGTNTLGWGEVQGSGVGTGTMGHSARRMAFATKRQNTIEQLHFLPGGGGGGVSSQALWTGSKNEVTV